MEVIELEAFIAITDHGTFTRAATALHISQPAISRRIDLLEIELGAPLFERLRSGARLTDAGEAFLPHARRALATLRDGAEAVRTLGSGEQGSVTLALVGTLASISLLARIRLFRSTYANVRLALRTANSSEVSRLVLSGEAHLGLRYFSDPASGLVSAHIADERLVVACAANSRQVPATTRRPDDLAGIPWVSFPAGTGSSGEPFARMVEQTLVRHGLEDGQRIVIDSLTAQKRMIEADFGVGLILASAIEEEISLGTMRVVDVEEIVASAPVVLVRRRDGYMSAAMQRLVTVLRDREEDQSSG